MLPDARPLPSVIGPTENALRALLVKVLTPTRIRTYPAWVILNAASNANAPADHWRDRVAGALKVEPHEVDKVVAELQQIGLMVNEGMLTITGQAELATARSAVSAATTRVVDGISEQEQATARLVLDRIRQTAEKLL